MSLYSSSSSQSDESVLRALGERIAAARLDRNLTQRELAQRAGVSRIVVQRLESGQAITTANLVRALRVLDLLDALDAALPQTHVSPVQELARRGKERRRASGSRGQKEPTAREREAWRWGDER